MIVRRHSTSGVVSRGPRESDYPFTIVVTPTTRSTGGSSSHSTVYDEIVATVTGANVTTEGTVTTAASLDEMVGTYINLTPEVATLNTTTTGALTRVTDGTANIAFQMGTYRRQVSTPISLVGGGTVTTPTGSFATGSLAKHCYDWFTAAVAGKTANSTTMNFLAGDGSRSAVTWVGALDTSCIITGATNGWQQGALIAPRFAVVASHVGVDTTYTCRDNSGNEVMRTVTGSTSLGLDRTLVCFDSSFTGITPAKLLPANFGNKYKPSQYLRQGVPLIKWKRNAAAWQIGLGIGNAGTGLSYTRPVAFTDWYVEWIGGDSGSPYGTVINESFVLLGNAWTGPGADDDGGSFIASNISGLTAAMEALVSGSSSTLSYADLSGFNTY